MIEEEVTHVHAQRLGLQEETVRDLLQSGWTLKSEFNRPDTFVSPAERVHATVVDLYEAEERTVSKDADEDLREKISEVVLADPGYAGSDYHPDVVTNIADAVYEHLGLVIEE